MYLVNFGLFLVDLVNVPVKAESQFVRLGVVGLDESRQITPASTLGCYGMYAVESACLIVNLTSSGNSRILVKKPLQDKRGYWMTVLM